MNDQPDRPSNGFEERAREDAAARPATRVVLTWEGDVLGANLRIEAEHCSPALVEGTLLRALAVIQRELLIIRMNEAAAQQAKLQADAARLRSQIERRGL